MYIFKDQLPQISAGSGLLVVYMVLRRLIIGPEAEGLFTLFAILFFLAGLCLLGLGILGEYIGRIYQEVLRRPRFVIKQELNPPLHHATSEPVRHE